MWVSKLQCSCVGRRNSYWATPDRQGKLRWKGQLGVNLNPHLQHSMWEET